MSTNVTSELQRRLSMVSFSVEEESHKPVKSLVVVVYGASGDLAKKKTFPALFALFRNELLPINTTIIGYARSKIANDDFQQRITKYIKVENAEEQQQLDSFLERVTYFQGKYDDPKAFQEFHECVCSHEKSLHAAVNNRLFYLALPPSVFATVVQHTKENAMSQTGFNRFIIEKPFGKDSESSAQMNQELSQYLTEEQIYRIDHYLGKEMVQNLMSLRFANSIFEPLWNHRHVEAVKITFKEDIGTGGRGGYFDDFGIIRDVMQNHLMQVLTLVAMEKPKSNDAEAIRDAKVEVLKNIEPLKLEDVVLGQYVGWTKEEQDRTIVQHGYRDDKTVPDDSNTATYAQALMYINNERWEGVPFIVKCGKGLEERKMEIRIQFKDTTDGFFGEIHRNELVMRVQPQEAIWMKMLVKKPGLVNKLEKTDLDLSYNQSFNDSKIPDAYTRLMHDVIVGSHQHFVRSDELELAWNIFTPLLHEIEESNVKPIEYEFGSRGPTEADEIAGKFMAKL